MVGPPGHSVTDLKTIQGWILERRFEAIPDVIEIGGFSHCAVPAKAEV